ncbi:oxidoreductase [Halorussus sp. MSC15.2]|uniref:oxidoreductase n=1 Tax=Halorussus sp. MSC15.2 TaxID=2283638 RepID=UPI0013D053DE|nr:oxidoreductase [Halorussus sp. MSC15.2]NEU58822.1 SDR family NAD(P)-dependent oxidoreductase [Halorussus sp. MSC15.2]
MSPNRGEWTADRMPEMDDRTVVVTGANSGLGYEATRAFARKGAHVVMACRSEDRGEDAKRRLRSEDTEGGHRGSLEVAELDLADLSSVESFAESFGDTHDELHVLCNNAGVMAIPRRETENGFEMQFGVNHLGHFALTGLLLDRLRETPGETRVVTQSSGVHENGDIDFADLQHEDAYDEWNAYAQSKLANVLFAYELQRRLDDASADVTSVACHPGYAATNLQRRGPEMAGSTLRLWAMKAANAVLAQSAEQGALPMLYAATAPQIEGGEYVGPGGLMNMRGPPSVQQSSDVSYDRERAERLWEVSEDLTGVTYDLKAATPAG